MDLSVIESSFLSELRKMGQPFKSNSRMPAPTRANVSKLEEEIKSWDSPHRDDALRYMEKVTPKKLFTMLHSMRRWYSGQTMAHGLREGRAELGLVMTLAPEELPDLYRGFKVPKDHPLASAQAGQRLELAVERNKGLSSWSTSPELVNRFSGGGKGKTGLVVKLVSAEGTQPLLAPPSHTVDWFNALYEKAVGSSFRPKEGEYLLDAPAVKVEVLRVKR